VIIKTNYLIIFLIFILSACKTPGDVRTETTTSERLTALELAVADAANAAEEIKMEHEYIKGQLERIEHLLIEKDSVTNLRIDEFMAKNKISEDTPGDTLDEKPEDANKNEELADPKNKLQNKNEIEEKTENQTEDKLENKDKVVSKTNPVQTLDQNYKKARAFHNQKKYEEAIPLYLEIMKSKSNWYKERAMFYIGVLNYDTGKYKESVISMQEFIDKYPKSKNVPAAILVQAESFIALKQKSDAKVFLEDLLLRFPGSKEALKAKTKIKNL
jgi:TolA-binding protein